MTSNSLPQELTDVFRGSDARNAGLVTPGQLRGPRFRRLFQDVYAPADIPVTHALRCRAAALLAPANAVLTGRSAATVLGVTLAKAYDPVEFVVPEKSRFGPIQGIRIRRTEVMRTESQAWQGVRIAKPVRIALDLLLRHSPRTRGWVRRLRIAVPDLDAFLRSGFVRQGKLERQLFRRRNRGIRLARNAFRLSDRRAESLPESELRVLIHLDGLCATPQYEVYMNGKLLGRLDLALEECKVAIEYDGKWHQSPNQLARDHDRRDRLRAEGWRFVVVTADRLATDYGGVLDEIHAAQKSHCGDD